ncbi:hypothetical protein AB6A40_007657 [Gnathostoma spinigerum]|uniref:HPS5-like beta-propeller domain-containing protein n=1 Tax=Gnathostoma spinigerum TaxID=75299 RepID=A0ABD6ELV3_9BILA
MSSEPLCEFDLQKNEQLFPPTSPCFANDSNGEVTEAAVFCRIPKYLFVELTSLDELSFPTSSSRIKYTCISASPHYLAVGSTSGTVYLFSRYASKYRARLSSVPVKVVSTKDGAVTRLAVSPDEKYLAVANQKGPVTITSLTNDGHSSALLVTNNCHVGTDNDGITNHVTEFCWSSDSSRLYAGDRKGQVSCTRVQGRYLFRSSCEVLWETDSEIVQMDLDGSTLLVSTLTRSCLCDLETLSCVQVGKKLRNGRMGAVFYRTQPPSFGNKQSNGVNDKSRGRKETVSLKLVFASRPNGRLWEANGLGVVYSTHQHRNLKNILYHPVVSFKRTFALEESSREDISRRLNYGKLYFIDCENKRLLLSQNGPSFSLVDPMDGSLLLTSDLKIDDCEIDCCVCGSDIFSLCREDGSLRKLSLFTFRKAVEKLYLRRCFAQVAQIISFYAKEINDVEDIPWNCDIIENIVDYVEQLDCTTLSDNCLQTSDVTRLKSVADAMKQQKKDSHLRCESPRKPSFIIRKLENGIHRVVRIMEYSGYEDDFTFRAPSPLRSRSKSTPNMESPLTNLKPNSWKQRSLPVSHENLGDAVYEGTGENIETPSDQKKALIQKAMKLLSENRETRSKLLRDGGNIDSLETILSSNEKHVEFESQVGTWFRYFLVFEFLII